MDAAIATLDVFPDNVFRGRWDAFFFFDADLLFERQSARRLETLLSCENGTVLCVRNLDIAHYEGNSNDTVFLEKETLAETYWAQLRGAATERRADGTIPSRKVRRPDGTVSFLLGPAWPSGGWITSFNRFGYTSEIGGWCIYCERTEEYGVIAVRQGGVPDKFSSALKEFDALPIEQAIENPRSYFLTPGILPEERRTKLLQNYSFGQEYKPSDKDADQKNG